MKFSKTDISIISIGLIIIALLFQVAPAKEVSRPEEIKSKRQVVYDDDSYVELARLWKAYHEEYPSEYSYANWMYAARYAGDENYSELLDRGVEKYPGNPTLLYLKGLESLGLEQDKAGLRFFERAVEIDPDFSDAWFGLVTHYMESGEDEKLNLALRKLLESGIIADEIMDYNYNVMIALEPEAIIITNGDNDTYPIWILKRMLNIRPDIDVVNRSLLNTTWYPGYLIEQGVPRFIKNDELTVLREAMFRKIKEAGGTMPIGGPVGDTLIMELIDAADKARRPVYLAKTMYLSETLKRLIDNGRDLGLVTLVTPSPADYTDQLRHMYEKWLSDFRTGGLISWRLMYAPEADAARFLITNYAFGIAANLRSLKEMAPKLRLELFNWYRDYIENLLPEDTRYRLAQAWSCRAVDIEAVSEWCRAQGIECEDTTEK